MNPSLKRQADKAARVYLNMRGYELLEQNWSAGSSRIDIIAKKGEAIYFCDLKVRLDEGAEVDLETMTKLNKRRQAAENWLNETKWTGRRSYLTITMVPPSFTIVGFSEDSL